MAQTECKNTDAILVQSPFNIIKRGQLKCIILNSMMLSLDEINNNNNNNNNNTTMLVKRFTQKSHSAKHKVQNKLQKNKQSYM